MKLKEINEKLGKFKIEDETKSAILDLIDEKVESDMKEVIHKIESLKNKIKIAYRVIGIAMVIIGLILFLFLTTASTV